MSIADLRHELAVLASELPMEPLTDAWERTELIASHLMAAWRSSDHPAARSAISAVTGAVDQLSGVVAELERVAAEIIRYNGAL